MPCRSAWGRLMWCLAARRDGSHVCQLAVRAIDLFSPATRGGDGRAKRRQRWSYFQAPLTPYGQWMDVPGSVWPGSRWRRTNLDWRPYMDAGHWDYTDAGWYWQSDYPCGDIAFHYGRWIRNDFTAGRWAWVPAYDWAPSWVAWRGRRRGHGLGSRLLALGCGLSSGRSGLVVARRAGREWGWISGWVLKSSLCGRWAGPLLGRGLPALRLRPRAGAGVLRT